MVAVGGCHTTMCVGPAARRIRAVGRFRPMRLRPELPRAGRLQTGRCPGDPEKPQASSPETTFCQGGVPEAPHTHGGALLGGPLVGGGPSRCQRISYATVAYATLAPGLYRPEMLLHRGKKKNEPSH